MLQTILGIVFLIILVDACAFARHKFIGGISDINFLIITLIADFIFIGLIIFL